jgi:hypothetical protein
MNFQEAVEDVHGDKFAFLGDVGDENDNEIEVDGGGLFAEAMNCSKRES